MKPIEYWSIPSIAENYNKDAGKDKISPDKTPAWGISDFIKSMDDQAFETLADIGCGPGNSSSILVDRLGFKTIHAIDCSEPILEYMSEYVDANKVNVKKQIADINTACFNIESESVDLAVAIRVFGYIYNIENVFKEVERILRVGGYFCFDLIYNGEILAPHKGNATNQLADFYIHSAPMIEDLCKKYRLSITGTGELYHRGCDTNVHSMAYLFILKKNV